MIVRQYGSNTLSRHEDVYWRHRGVLPITLLLHDHASVRIWHIGWALGHVFEPRGRVFPTILDYSHLVNAQRRALERCWRHRGCIAFDPSFLLFWTHGVCVRLCNFKIFKCWPFSSFCNMWILRSSFFCLFPSFSLVFAHSMIFTLFCAKNIKKVN